MLLRPTNAVWFEVLADREDLTPILRSLAAGGAVELESQSQGSAVHLLPRLQSGLDEYQRLAQRYASFWPVTLPLSAERHAGPEEILDAALERLRAWAAQADPLIAQLMKLEHERAELEELRPLFSQARAELPDLERLSRAGPILAGRIYLLEPGTAAVLIPPAVLAQRIDGAGRTFVLALGPRAQVAALDEALNALKARRLEPPGALFAGPEGALARLTARLDEIARLRQQLREQLAACDLAHALGAALADVALIEWLANRVPEFARTDHFVWITGWTSDRSGARLESSLSRAGIHHLLHVTGPPAKLTPPIVLHNPRWAQPFELFARLLGTPGANEADPSVLLALLAPLLFGFMFGDVGQGAVLVLIGLVLRKRYPATRLLISGGIAAMAFGVLFGSVFAREDILPALWVHPMQKPLSLLGVSLAGGCGVILIGLALDALEHYWAGKMLAWLSTRAGLVVSYLGMITSAIDVRALWLIAIGLGWFCIGEVARPGNRAQHLAEGIGEALETLLQLLVNTLSFVRVGAFALAHAGLASAVIALCAGIGPRSMAILGLAFGNALLILIEGLVVSIQTTRLVLFEFFIRFLRGSGRPFRPLRSPPTTFAMEPSRSS